VEMMLEGAPAGLLDAQRREMGAMR
jgi:hypothetical protein